MDHDDWLHELQRMSTRPDVPPGRLAYWDGGHLMVVPSVGQFRVRCMSCKWDGPDRGGDPHGVRLILDDIQDHYHHEGDPCPFHAQCTQCGAA